MSTFNRHKLGYFTKLNGRFFLSASEALRAADAGPEAAPEDVGRLAGQEAEGDWMRRLGIHVTLHHLLLAGAQPPPAPCGHRGPQPGP